MLLLVLPIKWNFFHFLLSHKKNCTFIHPQNILSRHHLSRKFNFVMSGRKNVKSFACTFPFAASFCYISNDQLFFLLQIFFHHRSLFLFVTILLIAKKFSFFFSFGFGTAVLSEIRFLHRDMIDTCFT